jgi:Ran GTPase-activating protein (RanGAP) involved in mRNA processing and transport
MPQNDKFEFTNLYINDEELKVICSVLKTKKQIQFLKLSSNWISDEGAKLLAQEIRLGNTIYKKIWLDQNAITGEGVKALAEALELTDQIDLLHLGANNIGTGKSREISKFRNVTSFRCGTAFDTCHITAHVFRLK